MFLLPQNVPALLAEFRLMQQEHTHTQMLAHMHALQIHYVWLTQADKISRSVCRKAFGFVLKWRKGNSFNFCYQVTSKTCYNKIISTCGLFKRITFFYAIDLQCRHPLKKHVYNHIFKLNWNNKISIMVEFRICHVLFFGISVSFSAVIGRNSLQNLHIENCYYGLWKYEQ